MYCEADAECFGEATTTMAVGREMFRSFCPYHAEVLSDAGLAVTMDFYEEVLKKNLQPSWLNRKWTDTAA